MTIGTLPGIATTVALYFVLQPLWSELCRRSVLVILSWSSLEALDVDGGLQFSHVHVPWSEACSGLNTLAVMLGLAVWSSLPAPAWSFSKRLTLAIAIAFGTNVGRAVSIAAGRLVLAPAWEGETVHFFLGFLWIAIGVSLFARAVRYRAGVDATSWVHAACVLAVVSVVSSWPGGTLAAACALTCLFATAPAPRAEHGAHVVLAWLACGCAIAWSQAESLWLPWLLACPYFGGYLLLRSLPGWITWLGTIPMVSMQPLWWWIALPMIAVMLRRIIRADESDARPEVVPVAPGRSRWVPALASACIPFILPHLIAPGFSPILPSPALMPKPVSASAYLVRAPGQAADLAVLWFGGRRGGRHHSLESCLTLRQVSARRIGDVLLRDGVWMTEFFLHEGAIHASYASYLVSSLLPWSSTGVHLVLQSPVESMDSDYFAMESRRTAEAIRSTLVEGTRAASKSL
jgi:exosortase/archaeosortase family protein